MGPGSYNNAMTSISQPEEFSKLVLDINCLFTSQAGLMKNLLESLFATDDMQFGARSKFEEFMNNKINNEAEKIQFLCLSNKLIKDEKITIDDIINTIKLIEKRWYNERANVFFYCLFIKKFLEEKKINLNSLESLLKNPEFGTKLLTANTADVRKDISSAISLLRMCGIFNNNNQTLEGRYYNP